MCQLTVPMRPALAPISGPLHFFVMQKGFFRCPLRAGRLCVCVTVSLLYRYWKSTVTGVSIQLAIHKRCPIVTDESIQSFPRFMDGDWRVTWNYNVFDNKRCPILSSLSGMPFCVLYFLLCVYYNRVLKVACRSAFSLFSLRMPAVFSIYVFF